MRKFLAWLLVFLFSISPAWAMEFVRQKNVATKIVVPIVDADGDFVSGATGLDTEIYTFADGTAPDGFVDLTAEATEIGSTGIYQIAFGSTEMNYQYIAFQVKTTSSGAKTQFGLIRTMLSPPAYLAATDDGGVINVTGGAVDTVTTTTTATNLTNLPNGTGTNQISLSNGKVLLQATQTGVTIPTVTTLTNAPSDSSGVTTLLSRIIGTLASGTHNAQSGDSYARLGAPAGASVSADVAAIKSDTAAILTDTEAMDTANELRTLLTGGTSALSTLTAANIWETNISAYSGAGYAGTYLKNLYDNQGNWLTATGFSTLTAQQVWEYATRVLTAGTNIALAKGTGVTGFNDIAASDVVTAMQAVASDFKADVSGLATSSEISALNDISAGDVWDVTLASHLGAGSTGYALNAAGSAGDPWSTSLPGAYGSGSAGYILGTYLNATVSSRSTYDGSDTSGVTTLLSRLSSARAGYLDKLNVTGTLANTDNASSFKATGFSTHSAADVWAVSTRLLTAGTNIGFPSSADIKTAIEADGSKLDHLWEMTEDDGGTRRLTTNALEQAPAGTGSGEADWTADEKADILAALGITDGAPTVTLDSLYQAIRVHR